MTDTTDEQLRHGAGDGNQADDAHSIAILSIPPTSRVLDVGAGNGQVARRLADRSCAVVAIESDPASAESVARYCERVIEADIETLDLDDALGDQRFDVLLLLDVLEHLKDPLSTLRRLVPFLAEGGSVVASIPNVTHAAVRLQLLSGRFTSTDEGLLDRNHLHFFDRDGAEGLLERAGLGITERLRVRRGLTETEIAIDPADFDPEVVAAAVADRDADTYQFILRAGLGNAPAPVEGSLAATLQHRLERTQDVLAEAQAYAAHLEDELKAAVASAHESETAQLHTRSRLDEVERALRERLGELEVLHRELRHLEADIEIKEAYGMELRGEIGRLHAHIQAEAGARTALQQQIAAIQNRATYRVVLRAEKRLEAHPYVRRGILLMIRRLRKRP